MAQACENKSPDGVDAFSINFKTEGFAQIIQTGVAAHQKFAVAERLDVKCCVLARHGTAENFFHDILHGDDSLCAAKFVHDHGHSLGTSKKKFEQLERAHGLGDKRRRQQFLGVVFRWVEQEQFYVDDPEDLIGSIGVNGEVGVAFLYVALKCIIYHEIVLQYYTVANQ